MKKKIQFDFRIKKQFHTFNIASGDFKKLYVIYCEAPNYSFEKYDLIKNNKKEFQYKRTILMRCAAYSDCLEQLIKNIKEC